MSKAIDGPAWQGRADFTLKVIDRRFISGPARSADEINDDNFLDDGYRFLREERISFSANDAAGVHRPERRRSTTSSCARSALPPLIPPISTRPLARSASSTPAATISFWSFSDPPRSHAA
jgi:hypothetical protein